MTADKVIKDGKIYAVNHGGLVTDEKILQTALTSVSKDNSEAYLDEVDAHKCYWSAMERDDLSKSL